MTPTKLTADLADIAADKLIRLAEDLEALSGIDLSAAPALVQQQAATTLRDSRVQAAGALERLAHETDYSIRLAARSQHNMIHARTAEAPDVLRGWARAWREFADA